MLWAQQDKICSNVVTGLRQVAEVIAGLSEARRSTALNAAARSYLNIARQLGYSEQDAQQWASAAMEQLLGDLQRVAEVAA